MQPYRLFFPLGALTAIFGTSLWIAFGFGTTAVYPGLSHPDIMIGGFIFAFASGFLMTAVPRFTGSRPCGPLELSTMVALFLALLSVSLLQNRFFFHLLSLASLVYLVSFCGNRFATKTYDPPRFFVFVGLGLGMGIAGAFLLALVDLGQLSGGWSTLGKLIYTQGMVLSLILGVGSQLLPALWGWAELPVQVARPGRMGKQESPKFLLLAVAALAALLVLSFLMESVSLVQSGRFVRAALVTGIAISQWKILRKPRSPGRLAFWLWISAWSLLVGLWLPFVWPAYAIHGIHIAFIGGFGLMTFMIASRVALAHGGYELQLELRSRALPATALLILFAALTRFAAPMVPRIYFHHLAYAAIVWICGIVVWSWVFVPKMLRPRAN